MDHEHVTSGALIEIRELKIGTHYIHYYVCSTEKKKSGMFSIFLKKWIMNKLLHRSCHGNSPWAKTLLKRLIVKMCIYFSWATNNCKRYTFHQDSSNLERKTSTLLENLEMFPWHYMHSNVFKSWLSQSTLKERH